MTIPQTFCAWKSFFLQWFESEASGTVKLPRVTIFPPIVNQDIQHIQCRGLLNFVWIFLFYKILQVVGCCAGANQNTAFTQ
jgi:hypothetical protein